MNRFAYLFFFMPVFNTCYAHMVCTGCNKGNFEIIDLIVTRDGPYSLFKKENQNRIKEVLKADPQKALIPMCKSNKRRFLHTVPLYLAVMYRNDKIAYFILTLPITIPASLQYKVLRDAIVNRHSVAMALDLITNYNFPVILRADRSTITNSFFKPFVTKCHFAETPENQEIYRQCFSHVLSRAKKALSKQDFYSFTRCATVCSYDLLKFAKDINHFRGQADFLASIFFCLNYYKVYKIFCFSGKAYENIKQFAQFRPMKKLLYAPKYEDI